MPQKTDQQDKAFKNWINKSLLQRMARSLSEVDPGFDRKKFVKLESQLGPLELKGRVQLVREQLKAQLPPDYRKALKLLLQSTKKSYLKGFDLWPYTDFIQTYGLNHFRESLEALRELTQLFTSEFAIRPFIRTETQRSLDYLLACAEDDNAHIRRWASEGSRPRLPWGEKLHGLIDQPELTLPLLEKLKYDEELYVRKSVANHLNDIAKDHPDIVIKTLNRWSNEAPARHRQKIDWIIYRSLRTLIKQGHLEALKLIGVDAKTKIKVERITLTKKDLRLGERLEFNFKICSACSKSQKLVIDYIIHFVKANKQLSPKVFKIKNLILNAKGEVQIQKNHHLKKITTRTFYPGTHILEIQINGKSYGKKPFQLR